LARAFFGGCTSASAQGPWSPRGQRRASQSARERPLLVKSLEVRRALAISTDIARRRCERPRFNAPPATAAVRFRWFAILDPGPRNPPSLCGCTVGQIAVLATKIEFSRNSKPISGHLPFAALHCWLTCLPAHCLRAAALLSATWLHGGESAPVLPSPDARSTTCFRRRARLHNRHIPAGRVKQRSHLFASFNTG
jgi:hypothetical protein